MKKKTIFITGFVSILVCCLLCFRSFFCILHTSSVDVKHGIGLSNVATILAKEKIITNRFLFKVYTRAWMVFNDCDIVQEGEYRVEKGESFGKTLERLCGGKTILNCITIPEGVETREVVEIVNNNQFLSGDKIFAEEEAIILPETYCFSKNTKREVIFNDMKKHLNDHINRLWDERVRNEFINTKKELLILASIVEKEAKTDEERPIIAGIYLNRMVKGMKLEACPTAIYEITKGRYKFKRTLTIKDTQTKGEYNTYRKKGLPIAPICNPGINSILAVLHPVETKYLYFVAKADLSGHLFAENYNDHLKNIKDVKEEQRAGRKTF